MEGILWMLIVGFIVAFILAFAVGANDVANSFGTTVGARTLTLFQACILASIFETLGAILLGAKVGETIRKGIIDADIYAGQEELLMAGEVSAMIGSCLWQLLATFLKLPVSGTHSIVGATVGFSLVAMGAKGVNWVKMGMIVASWIISPVLAGGMAALFYLLLKTLIFSKADPVPPGFIALPVLYGITIAINFFSVLISGAPLLGFNSIPVQWDAVMAVALGLLVAIFVRMFIVKRMKRSINKIKEEELTKQLLDTKPTIGIEGPRKPIAQAPINLDPIAEKKEPLTESAEGSLNNSSTSKTPNGSNNHIATKATNGIGHPPSYSEATESPRQIKFDTEEEREKSFQEAKAKRQEMNKTRSKSARDHTPSIRIPLVLQLEKQVIQSTAAEPNVQSLKQAIRKNFSEPAMMDLVEKSEGEVYTVFINRNQHAVTIHRKTGRHRTVSNGSGGDHFHAVPVQRSYSEMNGGKGDARPIHPPMLDEPFDESEDEGLMMQEKSQLDLPDTYSNEVAYTDAIETGFRRMTLHPMEETVEIKVDLPDDIEKGREPAHTLTSDENEERFEVCKIFSFLQILTACFGAFAHGGNDVSNAIGPLIALYIIYSDGLVTQASATPIWILLYGGVGICVGLWVWGRRVIKTMGEDITSLTPSRGFTIELSSAVTVLAASNIGIPVSTTHCKVGAVVAVGWVRSFSAVDWKIFRNIVLAWFVTVPVSGGLSALVFAGIRAAANL